MNDWWERLLCDLWNSVKNGASNNEISMKQSRLLSGMKFVRLDLHVAITSVVGVARSILTLAIDAAGSSRGASR